MEKSKSTTLDQGGEIMIYVGIDWADDHHDVAITDDSAKTLSQFQISHDSSGFATLHGQLAKFKQSPDQILIALETSRGLLIHELLRSDYSVYAVNPRAVNRYKDRYVLSKAKSDSLDALALAHLLRTDRQRFKALRPFPEDYRLLDRLCQDLRKLVEEKSRISNQMTSVLKEFYPKALELFSLDSRIGIAFLKTFPDPQALRSCKKKTFMAFFRKHHYTRPNKIEELWTLIQTPALEPDLVICKAGRFRLLALLDQLIPLREHLSLYEKEVKTILDKLPEAKSINSLPGVGDRLAPELTAALGPKGSGSQSRFQSAEEIMNLSGCVPVTRQSGKWKTVSFRYACVKGLRRTFRDWAFASLEQSVWARAYYDFYKAMNMPHSTILRNLGKKWARILFVLWSQGTVYNEPLYIQSLKNHNVRWAMAL
jgi:transposase